MAFNAPSLFETVSRTAYESQINQNFQKIQTAFQQIQNELPRISNIGVGGNLNFTERAVRLNGIGGVQSFVPLFDTDFQTVQLAAQGDDSVSWCVISGLYHHTTNEPSHSLVSIAAAGDGTYPVSIGVKTLGAPSLETVVEAYETDLTADLVLYTFDYHRVGSSYWVSNLRLNADILMDRDAFVKTIQMEQHVVIPITGTLPASAGYLNPVFVVPFNMEILGADFYLGTAPSGSAVSVELHKQSNPTDGNILDSAASWSSGSSGVQSVNGQSPTIQVAEGDVIQPYLSEADEGTDGTTAADLSIVLRYRRLYTELL